MQDYAIVPARQDALAKHPDTRINILESESA
jgi:hypothetical protein